MNSHLTWRLTATVIGSYLAAHIFAGCKTTTHDTSIVKAEEQGATSTYLGAYAGVYATSFINQIGPSIRGIEGATSLSITVDGSSTNLTFSRLDHQVTTIAAAKVTQRCSLLTCYRFEAEPLVITLTGEPVTGATLFLTIEDMSGYDDPTSVDTVTSVSLQRSSASHFPAVGGDGSDAAGGVIRTGNLELRLGADRRYGLAIDDETGQAYEIRQIATVHDGDKTWLKYCPVSDRDARTEFSVELDATGKPLRTRKDILISLSFVSVDRDGTEHNNWDGTRVFGDR